jgi:predicted enzyme related to lactoylglutathione lyase
MTRTTYRHGHFVWHELMTTDAAGAEKFYTELFGWTFKHSPGANGIYRVLSAGGRELGGIVEVSADCGFPPFWSGYISVPDVDQAARTAVENGGTVTFGPFDIPNIGRLANVMDSEGAAFIVFHDHKGDGTSEAMPKMGEFCWDSLATSDAERALAFYGAVVGWTRGKFGDAPGLFFAASDGETVADTDTPAPGAPASWTTHVVIHELTSARAKAESLGAKVLVPEINVPNVGKMAIIADPWGAVISLFESAMPG